MRVSAAFSSSDKSMDTAQEGEVEDVGMGEEEVISRDENGRYGGGRDREGGAVSPSKAMNFINGGCPAQDIISSSRKFHSMDVVPPGDEELDPELSPNSKKIRFNQSFSEKTETNDYIKFVNSTMNSATKIAPGLDGGYMSRFDMDVESENLQTDIDEETSPNVPQNVPKDIPKDVPKDVPKDIDVTPKKNLWTKDSTGNVPRWVKKPNGDTDSAPGSGTKPADTSTGSNKGVSRDKVKEKDREKEKEKEKDREK